MKKEFTIMLDEDLKNKFEIAIQLNKENTDDVFDKLIRSYIAHTFTQVAAAYEQPKTPVFPPENGENYGKAIQRIPKWAKKPTQINHKIIRAFLQLAEIGTVTYTALAEHCTNEANSDIYVSTFSSNFAQMKFDEGNSHGKVFEVNKEGIVTIWDIVVPTLMTYKNEFLHHSTDIGYLNRNNQRNLGKTQKNGTGYMQSLYRMCCEDCGYEYSANGSDIFLKKCPSCQGGADTGR